MRYQLVKSILALAMLCGMALSPRLWLTERHYPLVPVWDGLPTVPPPVDAVVYGAMLLLLCWVALPFRSRWPLVAFLVLAGIWSLWDQSRWQPWFYQYLFMLAALLVAGSDPERRVASLHVCRFIVAATYIWSGIQKVNVTFAVDIYPWMMGPVLRLMPDAVSGCLLEQGWTAAVVECGLGVGLLVWPLRVVAVPLLVLMHAMILFCLGPFGHSWNSVVWPWNLAMMALVVVLFAHTRDVQPRHILWPRRFRFARVALVLFGVMPLFSFFGWWDAYLSAALYSGNTLLPRIYVSDTIEERLPPEVRANHLVGLEVNVAGWSIEELNVPPYPARRVYRGIARRLAALGDSRDEVTLDVQERPNWRTGERTTTREDLDGP